MAEEVVTDETSTPDMAPTAAADVDTDADQPVDEPFMPVALHDEFKGSQPPEDGDGVLLIGWDEPDATTTAN